MNLSKWIRQTHRWLSIIFTATVAANFATMAFGGASGLGGLFAAAAALPAAVQRALHVRAALCREIARGEQERARVGRWPRRRESRRPRQSGRAKPALLSGGNPQIAKGYGDAPVQAYIAAMPGWKSDVGRRIDALIERAVPDVYKAVKWNSPLYGIEGEGWFLGLHCFTRYVKVAFFRGASLRSRPSRQFQAKGSALSRHP